MSNDYYVKEILEIIKIKNKKNKQKKAVIFSSITAFLILIVSIIFFASNAFADNKVDLIKDGEGREYLYFEIDHTLSNAKYKYYGYGYTVALYDRSTNKFLDLDNGTEQGKQVFMPNNSFKPQMVGSKEYVQIYIEDLLKATGVKEEYFYSESLTIYLNGRLGIKVDGKLVHLYDSLEGNVLFGMPEGHDTRDYTTNEDGKAKLNGDRYGIKNAIEHYYGTSWSSSTQGQLNQNFNIKYDLNPAAGYDALFVEYRCDGERIGYEGIKQFESEKVENVTIKSIPGYKYNGTYKKGKFYDRNMVSESGDTITVNIKKASKTYTPIYHHIVINYDKLPNPGTPVNVNVEYRKNTITGEELLASEKVTGYFNQPFYLTSKQIENMKCKGYYVIDKKGNSTYFENTAVSIKYLIEEIKIIFIYEDIPIVVIPKCEPRFDYQTPDVTIYMKKKDFENTNFINISNQIYSISNVKVGEDKDRNKLEGEHKYHYFDFYVYSEDKKETLTDRHDINGTQATHSFTVKKGEFNKINEEQYKAYFPTTYGVFCTCKGVGFRFLGSVSVTINLIENKPPIAHFYPCTEVEQENGQTRTIDKVYIDQVSTLRNDANDPNGIDDIDIISWSFVDENMNRFTLKVLRQFGKYEIVSNTINDSERIEFIDMTENGDLKLIFKTDDIWTVNQLVKDIEDLQDIYTDTVKPVTLDLNPIAILTDDFELNYPFGTSFSVKQNRVMGFSSKNSMVADFLKGTKVKIDHSKDCVEIIPLNNQDINSIYFVNDIKATKTNGMIKIDNVNFTYQQVMFKELGKYKVRLQVTDTEGRVSKWTEQTINVVEDIEPTTYANIVNKFYRKKEQNGNATIVLNNVTGISLDKDIAKIESVYYKYDSNNDGLFNDEKLIPLTLLNSQVSFTTKELGKYQLIVNVIEDFGQPTILKYINENDYRKATVTFVTEVDNFAPQVINFEIKRKGN